MLISPAAEEGGLPTPVRGLAIGGGRLHKKTAGRKTPPVAPTSPPSVRAGTPVSHRTAVMALASPGGAVGGHGPTDPTPPSDSLRAEVTKAAPISTAKRSKAVVTTPVAQERVSSRPKGAKGNLPALQRAQLLLAQKNMETEGNPLPRFTIFDDYSDECLGSILGDSGVDLSDEGEARELLSLIRSKEIAQAALAQAAAARAATAPEEAGASLVPVARPDRADTAAGAALSPPARGPVRTRRVAKAVTARGIRLRNRII